MRAGARQEGEAGAGVAVISAFETEDRFSVLIPMTLNVSFTFQGAGCRSLILQPFCLYIYPEFLNASVAPVRPLPGQGREQVWMAS